jgi:hypothetical protein
MRLLPAVFMLFHSQMASAQALPDALTKAVKANPQRFVEDAAEVIHGFGSPGAEPGVDASGIDRAIALARAVARAGALRRLLAADLDADGAVTAAEMAVLAAAAEARDRGPLIALQAEADRDADGTASAPELMAAAQEEALRSYPERKAALLRDLFRFDADKDGRVTLAEVRSAVDRIAGAT